ncbi:TadE/TadG family type IV pilus assembly protein [Sphaerisporangium sp. B11E5]|uniref:TadE/TadG family type IV pilus assembly protein n=1 Tax=Sphaerisporangium sp. B11E5 TaxID=3153563 RepID=UPI00325E8A41
MTSETAVAFPFVLLLILLIVQFGVWQHATHVAQVTAMEALASTRVYGGSPTAGRVKASSMLARLGHSVLHSTHVSVSRTSDAARVEVAGVAQAVVPFLRLPVNSVAYGPVERFRGDGR